MDLALFPQRHFFEAPTLLQTCCRDTNTVFGICLIRSWLYLSVLLMGRSPSAVFSEPFLFQITLLIPCLSSTPLFSSHVARGLFDKDWFCFKTLAFSLDQVNTKKCTLNKLGCYFPLETNIYQCYLYVTTIYKYN